MTTDVDVQFFTHNNGLVLSNNWGDMIRLLDQTLVNGVSLPQIATALTDEEGNVQLTFNTAHKVALLQVVQLTAFAPNELNQKYRVKGVPNSTSLILKPKNDLASTMVSAVGAAKLAPLGYKIIFRDVDDVKRVYRAIDPSIEHPYIRVDESILSDTGSYDASYAKTAMVGLIEHMEHIDDYLDPNKLQLPFVPANLDQNWKNTGTGVNVVRGLSKWVWARSNNAHQSWNDTQTITEGNRSFSLVGNKDAFYLNTALGTTTWAKRVYGAGLFNSCLKNDVVPNWFLMSRYSSAAASTNYSISEALMSPLVTSEASSRFMIPRFIEESRLTGHTTARPILPDYTSGVSNLYSGSDIAPLEIPFSDGYSILRGSLKHVMYDGKTKSNIGVAYATVHESSMYLHDSVAYTTSGSTGGSVLFYLGEL